MITKANNVRNVNVVLTVLIPEEKFAASPGDSEVTRGAASEGWQEFKVLLRGT